MHIGSLCAGFAKSHSFARGIRPIVVRTLPLPMSNRFDSLPEHVQRPQVRRFLPEVRPAKAKDQSGKEHDVAVVTVASIQEEVDPAAAEGGEAPTEEKK